MKWKGWYIRNIFGIFTSFYNTPMIHDNFNSEYLFLRLNCYTRVSLQYFSTHKKITTETYYIYKIREKLVSREVLKERWFYMKYIGKISSLLPCNCILYTADKRICKHTAGRLNKNSAWALFSELNEAGVGLMEWLVCLLSEEAECRKSFSFFSINTFFSSLKCDS